MYPQVEQLETKERRVVRRLQLLEELADPRRTERRRTRRLFALSAPRLFKPREARCVAEPKCC